jgi:hypothetical protein
MTFVMTLSYHDMTIYDFLRIIIDQVREIAGLRAGGDCFLVVARGAGAFLVVTRVVVAVATTSATSPLGARAVSASVGG